MRGGQVDPLRTHSTGPHQAPRDCPVCGEHLATTRLGCTACGTEVSGLFASCIYCGLGSADRAMLRVFLVSRGNMKEVERFLGVSYPTARQRFAELLERLGLAEPAPEPGSEPGLDRAPESTGAPGDEPTARILLRLAAGELDVDEAEALLQD